MNRVRGLTQSFLSIVYKSRLKGVLNLNPMQIEPEGFHWLDSLTTTEVWKTPLAGLGHTTMSLRMSTVLSYYRFSDRSKWLLHNLHNIKRSKFLPRFSHTHISLAVWRIAPLVSIDVLEDLDHRCKSRFLVFHYYSMT